MRREKLEKLSKEELIEITMVLMEKVAELERKLNMNSTNSSKPPSSDQWTKPKSRETKSEKKPGGQPGHKGHGLKIEREPDETVKLKALVCEQCGKDISESEGCICDVRFKIDVKIETKLIKYEQYKVVCPFCENINQKDFPENVNSTLQYGESVRALSVLFTNYAMVGYDKTHKIMNDVFGIPIKASTIANHTKDFADKCTPILAEICGQLKNSDILNCDETGVRVGGGKQWLHTASNAQATYNTVHENRGQKGTDDNGVLKGFEGTAVHDCWQPYFKYENCQHALCNAHLLRELQGVIDNTEQTWARKMQSLLREMKEVVDRYKQAGKTNLSLYYKKKFADSYALIVKLGEEENPLALKESGRKGKPKRGKTRCLLDRFIMYRTEICRFADNFCVPFDNNQAERDIRNAKIKLKVSGCFRSVGGAKNFGKISSVIGTALKQGIGAFKTVSGIFSGSLSSLFPKPSPTTD